MVYDFLVYGLTGVEKVWDFLVGLWINRGGGGLGLFGGGFLGGFERFFEFYV